MKLKTQDDFLSQIGNRIYRDKGTCECEHCKDVYENGVVVLDRQHAIYLADIAAAYMVDGIDLNYRTKVVPNKDYDGMDCYACERMIKENKNQEEIDEEHSNCHGWYHCGPECCGECHVCGT